MTPPRKKIKNDEEFQTPDEGYLSRSSIDIEQTPEHPDVTELSHSKSKYPKKMQFFMEG